MIKSYFGDIRQLIINELKSAKHDIYVAVAWITDHHLLQILQEKLKEEIDVKMVLVKDEINLNNGFDYDFFKKTGGSIYWDNHHHKFCVIDRKTVITGSYNWTFAAHNRSSRENILIIKNEDELLENYATEFKVLIRQAEKFSSTAYSAKINRDFDCFYDDGTLEIIEEFSVIQFNKAGFRLSKKIKLDSNGRLVILAMNALTKTQFNIFILNSLSRTVSENSILNIDEISIFIVTNQRNEEGIIIGSRIKV